MSTKWTLSSIVILCCITSTLSNNNDTLSISELFNTTWKLKETRRTFHKNCAALEKILSIDIKNSGTLSAKMIYRKGRYLYNYGGSKVSEKSFNKLLKYQKLDQIFSLNESQKPLLLDYYKESKKERLLFGVTTGFITVAGLSVLPTLAYLFTDREDKARAFGIVALASAGVGLVLEVPLFITIGKNGKKRKRLFFLHNRNVVLDYQKSK